MLSSEDNELASNVRMDHLLGIDVVMPDLLIKWVNMNQTCVLFMHLKIIVISIPLILLSFSRSLFNIIVTMAQIEKPKN